MQSIECFIINKFEISKREISELKKYYPEKYLNWVKEIDLQLKSIKQDPK